MVFRKPYAFLIKKKKKIHILMLICWALIYYKIYLVKDFVKEFISFGTYNKSLENISSKLSFFFYLTIIFMIIVSLALLLLLRYKKKPWKLYLIVVLEYVFMMYATISLTSFFKSYDAQDAISTIFFNRDILNIASWIQYLVLIILILRITGLDLKKFSFSSDKEFLELSSDDREEFEINIEFDKHSILRKYNQVKRNLNYFYQEHKFVIRIVLIALISITVGYSYYYFGVKHRSYKEGQTFTSGIYNITLEKSYVTNKDSSGNVIEENSKFIILKIKIRNNDSEDVEPTFSRYHLMNSSIDTTNTIYYDNYFTDLGSVVSSDSILHSEQEKEFALVYKVPKKLDNNRFVLYFQEYNEDANNTYLRKIKLKVNDLSKIENKKLYNMGDTINIIDDKTISFDSIDIQDGFTYNKYTCDNGEKCSIEEKNLTAQTGKKVLKITFASSDYEGKEFIDFSCKYGRIKYVDSNGKIQYYNITNLISTDYEGKEMFIDITNQISESNEIYISYLVRNKQYDVRIK